MADQIIVYSSTFQVGEWSRSATNKPQLDDSCSEVDFGAALMSAHDNATSSLFPLLLQASTKCNLSIPPDKGEEFTAN